MDSFPDLTGRRTLNSLLVSMHRPSTTPDTSLSATIPVFHPSVFVSSIRNPRPSRPATPNAPPTPAPSFDNHLSLLREVEQLRKENVDLRLKHKNLKAIHEKTVDEYRKMARASLVLHSEHSTLNSLATTLQTDQERYRAAVLQLSTQPQMKQLADSAAARKETEDALKKDIQRLEKALQSEQRKSESLQDKLVILDDYVTRVLQETARKYALEAASVASAEDGAAEEMSPPPQRSTHTPVSDAGYGDATPMDSARSSFSTPMSMELLYSQADAAVPPSAPTHTHHRHNSAATNSTHVNSNTNTNTNSNIYAHGGSVGVKDYVKSGGTHARQGVPLDAPVTSRDDTNIDTGVGSGRYHNEHRNSERPGKLVFSLTTLPDLAEVDEDSVNFSVRKEKMDFAKPELGKLVSHASFPSPPLPRSGTVPAESSTWSRRASSSMGSTPGISAGKNTTQNTIQNSKVVDSSPPEFFETGILDSVSKDAASGLTTEEWHAMTERWAQWVGCRECAPAPTQAVIARAQADFMTYCRPLLPLARQARESHLAEQWENTLGKQKFGKSGRGGSRFSETYTDPAGTCEAWARLQESLGDVSGALSRLQHVVSTQRDALQEAGKRASSAIAAREQAERSEKEAKEEGERASQECLLLIKRVAELEARVRDLEGSLREEKVVGALAIERLKKELAKVQLELQSEGHGEGEGGS